MNKKLLKKFSVKDKTAQKELIRAHGMIILLSFALSTQLILTAVIDIDYDRSLSALVGVLLAFVTITSLFVVISLIRSKK